MAGAFNGKREITLTTLGEYFGWTFVLGETYLNEEGNPVNIWVAQQLPGRMVEICNPKEPYKHLVLADEVV